jgi:uncharacterized protein (TIGR02996 family)
MNDLLRAVLDNPAADSPRLAYAAWLDDNGCSEGAEFIRSQLRLARDPSAHGPDCREEDPCVLCWQSSDLIGPGWPSWWGPLAGTWGETWLTPVLVAECVVGTGRYESSMLLTVGRGFVAGVECGPDDWLAHGPTVCESHPIEAVVIDSAEPRYLPRRGWVWSSDPADAGEPYHVPREWGPVPGVFPTRQEALDAYHASALAWAGSRTVSECLVVD